MLNTPEAVIVPEEVIGPPVKVRPVEPPETCTDETLAPDEANGKDPTRARLFTPPCFNQIESDREMEVAFEKPAQGIDWPLARIGRKRSMSIFFIRLIIEL